MQLMFLRFYLKLIFVFFHFHNDASESNIFSPDCYIYSGVYEVIK